MNEQEILDSKPKGDFKSVIIQPNAITWGPHEYRAILDIQTIVDLRRENTELEKGRDEFKDKSRTLDNQLHELYHAMELISKIARIAPQDTAILEVTNCYRTDELLKAHNLEQQMQAIKQACEYAQTSLFETSDAFGDDYEGRHQKQGALAFKGRCMAFINRQDKALKEQGE